MEKFDLKYDFSVKDYFNKNRGDKPILNVLQTNWNFYKNNFETWFCQIDTFYEETCNMPM